ncbi:MAG: ferritin [Calditrichia bacterium]
MIKQNINELLSQQMNNELSSSHFYLAVASYFFHANLDGFGMWMLKQADEEREHAMKFYRHIIERGGKVHFGSIKEPVHEFKSPLDAFNQVLEHERKVTANINNIMDVAMNEKDHATIVFMQWFVEEQVEEENSAEGVVEKLKMIGDNFQGLMMLDAKMGTRQ